MQLESFVQGRWHAGDGEAVTLRDATTGEVIAYASAGGIDFGAVLEHARIVGGANLRHLTFHERAAMLKAYRWQYIVSGVQDPRFQAILGDMITPAQGERIGRALAPIVG